MIWPPLTKLFACRFIRLEQTALIQVSELRLYCGAGDQVLKNFFECLDDECRVDIQHAAGNGFTNIDSTVRGATVDVDAREFNVDTSGSINVNERGSQSMMESASMPDNTCDDAFLLSGPGGAYGGNGGDVKYRNVDCVEYPAGHQAWGDAKQPFAFGGAGGVSWQDFAPRYPGGRGGGRIHVAASDRIALFAATSMTANGGRPRQKTNNCPMAGAGAGGSIWLEAPTITGRSTVQANGEQGDSAGGSCMGGSGSGGRIALWVDTGKLGRSINAIAQGGSYSYSTGGAAGTVYINDGGRGLLRIDNGGITNHEAYTPWPPALYNELDWLVLQYPGRLSVAAGASVSVRNLRAEASTYLFSPHFALAVGTATMDGFVDVEQSLDMSELASDSPLARRSTSGDSDESSCQGMMVKHWIRATSNWKCSEPLCEINIIAPHAGVSLRGTMTASSVDIQAETVHLFNNFMARWRGMPPGHGAGSPYLSADAMRLSCYQAGGGGAYGGNAGDGTIAKGCAQQQGGVAYGDVARPFEFGSGGGTAVVAGLVHAADREYKVDSALSKALLDQQAGGNGGGRVRVVGSKALHLGAGTTFYVDGRDGFYTDNENWSGGGGSGGSIWLDSANITTDQSQVKLYARGGRASTTANTGGTGSGGRIALYSGNELPWKYLTMYVNGGSYSIQHRGASGTIFAQEHGFNNTLIIDNEGNDPDTVTPLPATIPPLNLVEVREQGRLGLALNQTLKARHVAVRSTGEVYSDDRLRVDTELLETWGDVVGKKAVEIHDRSWRESRFEDNTYACGPSGMYEDWTLELSPGAHDAFVNTAEALTDGSYATGASTDPSANPSYMIAEFPEPRPVYGMMFGYDQTEGQKRQFSDFSSIYVEWSDDKETWKRAYTAGGSSTATLYWNHDHSPHRYWRLRRTSRITLGEWNILCRDTGARFYSGSNLECRDHLCDVKIDVTSPASSVNFFVGVNKVPSLDINAATYRMFGVTFNANYKGYHVGEGPGTPPRLTDSHVPGRCEWGMTGAGAAHGSHGANSCYKVVPDCALDAVDYARGSQYAYGSVDQPFAFGSGGGAPYHSSQSSSERGRVGKNGAGGGRIRIRASGDVHVIGSYLYANGQHGSTVVTPAASLGTGGGSGGSVHVRGRNVWAWQSMATANGGGSYVAGSGGGGSGGRISVEGGSFDHTGLTTTVYGGWASTSQSCKGAAGSWYYATTHNQTLKYHTTYDMSDDAYTPMPTFNGGPNAFSKPQSNLEIELSSHVHLWTDSDRPIVARRFRALSSNTYVSGDDVRFQVATIDSAAVTNGWSRVVFASDVAATSPNGAHAQSTPENERVIRLRSHVTCSGRAAYCPVTVNAPGHLFELTSSVRINATDIDIVANDVVLMSSSQLTTQGRGGEYGFPGTGFNASTTGIFRCEGSTQSGGGGGHGGVGGVGCYASLACARPLAAGGAAYGSAVHPRTYGSGGGTSNSSHGVYRLGGQGGGRVFVTAANKLELQSSAYIRSNGDRGWFADSGISPNRYASSGGGSGGSALVYARYIIGSGYVEANGGRSGHSSYQSGSGAGGRVAVYAGTIEPSVNIRAITDTSWSTEVSSDPTNDCRGDDGTVIRDPQSALLAVPGRVSSVSTQALASAVRVSWTAPDDDGDVDGSAIVAYLVKNNITGDVTTVLADGADVPTEVIIHAEPGQAATFTVAAVNRAGVGAFTESPTVAVTPTDSQPPTPLTAWIRSISHVDGEAERNAVLYVSFDTDIVAASGVATIHSTSCLMDNGGDVSKCAPIAEASTSNADTALVSTAHNVSNFLAIQLDTTLPPSVDVTVRVPSGLVESKASQEPCIPADLETTVAHEDTAPSITVTVPAMGATVAQEDSSNRLSLQWSEPVNINLGMWKKVAVRNTRARSFGLDVAFDTYIFEDDFEQEFKKESRGVGYLETDKWQSVPSAERFGPNLSPDKSPALMKLVTVEYNNYTDPWFSGPALRMSKVGIDVSRYYMQRTKQSFNFAPGSSVVFSVGFRTSDLGSNKLVYYPDKPTKLSTVYGEPLLVYLSNPDMTLRRYMYMRVRASTSSWDVYLNYRNSEGRTAGSSTVALKPNSFYELVVTSGYDTGANFGDNAAGPYANSNTPQSPPMMARVLNHEGVTVCSLAMNSDLSDMGDFFVYMGHYTPNVAATYAVDVTVTHVRMGGLRNPATVYASGLVHNSSVTTAILDDAAYPVSGMSYAVDIPAGLVVDRRFVSASALPWTGDNAWTFTAATIAKSMSLAATYPAHDVGVVPVGTDKLRMTFNGPIVVGSGTVKVLAQDDSVLHEVNVATPGAALTSCATASVSIPPTVLSDYSTVYQVVVDEGAFVLADDAGALSPAIAVGEWKFTTSADGAGPILIGMWPRPGRTDVPTQSPNVTMLFDESVMVGQGSVRIVTNIGGVTTATVDVSTPDAVVIDGSLAIVTLPPSALELDTTAYHVRVSGGAFTDLRGNPFSGINNKRWAFTTLDSTPPAVTAMEPAHGANDVQHGATYFTLTFTEPVMASKGYLNITSIAPASQLGVTASDGGMYNELVYDMVSVLDTSRVVVVGDVVRIRPSEEAVSLYSAPVSVHIPPASFIDMSGKPFEGVSAGSWEFMTEADTYPPVVYNVFPLSSSQNVDLESGIDLQITFSEHVKRGTGHLVVTDTTANSVTYIPIANVTIADNELEVPFPAAAVASGHAYSVSLESGAILDRHNNPLGSWPGWVFTSRDTQPPELVSLSPVAGTEGMDLSRRELSLVFSEPVVAGDGTIEVREAVTAVSKLVVRVSDITKVVISGTQVTIRVPATALSSFDTLYEVLVPRGGFKDGSGNPAAPIDVGSWQFRTRPDDIPPVPEWAEPPFGSEGVLADRSQFMLTFDENIVAHREGRGARIRELETDDVVFEFDLNDDNQFRVAVRSATFWTSGLSLKSDTQYYFDVDAGLLADSLGNEFGGLGKPGTARLLADVSAGGELRELAATTAAVWVFRIADFTGPVLTGVSPANGQADVPVSHRSLTMTFSEPVYRGTGSVEVYETAQGQPVQSISVKSSAITIYGNVVSVRLSGSAIALEFTDYHVRMTKGAFTDRSLNDFAGIGDSTTWHFVTVQDSTRPTVVPAESSPASGDVGVSQSTSTLTVAFSEPVVAAAAASSSAGVKLVDGASGQVTVLGLDSAVFVDDSVLFSVPLGTFGENTRYTVIVPAGIVEDTSGNVIVPHSGYSFVTEDSTPPQVVSVHPANGAADIVDLKTLRINFNEVVVVLAGYIVVTNEATGEETGSFSVSDPTRVTVTGSSVVVALDSRTTSSPNTKYVITLVPKDGGPVFEDTSNNDLAGLPEWSFTTAPDVQAPRASTLTPFNTQLVQFGSLNELIIEFNEVVKLPTATGVANLTVTRAGAPVPVAHVDLVAPGDGVSVSIVGSSIVVEFTDNIDDLPLSTYLVTLAPGAVLDNSDNLFGGLSAGSWSIRTGVQMCSAPSECASGVCAAGACAEPTCGDGVLNQDETSVDCGGSTCARCPVDASCAVAADCVSGVCVDGVCAAPTCTDGVLNGAEGDIDCGASCPTLCGVGATCGQRGDCESSACSLAGICLAPSCSDLVKNGDEVSCA